MVVFVCLWGGGVRVRGGYDGVSFLSSLFVCCWGFFVGFCVSWVWVCLLAVCLLLTNP